MQKNIELEDYFAFLQALKIAPKKSRKIALDSALNRVLAENIVCKIDIPRFNNSAMDGFALRFKDGCSPYESYEIKGEIFAGDSRKYFLQKNDTFRITTGAKVPKNCDCVIQKEKVKIHANRVILKANPAKNQCIKMRGEDFKKGKVLLKKGAILDANALGILASQGISEVSVKKRVKIIIFGSGNEIAQLNSRLKNNQIYDINSHFIRANFSHLNCKIKYGGILGDNPKILREKIAQFAQKYDIIITSGGVSVGEKDYIHKILRDLGAKMLIDGVNIKPGRPVVLSRLKNSFILSLPGNPIGAFLHSYFALPLLIAKFSGVEFSSFYDLLQSREMANHSDFKATKGTAHIMLGNVENGEFVAFNNGKFQGAQVAPLLKSEALAIVQNRDLVKKGEAIRALPYIVRFQ